MPLPACAQDENASYSASPEEDFQCAIWAAVTGGMLELGDPEARVAFLMATSFFLGRYEAATGRSVADNWDREAATEVGENLSAFADICAPRMERMGANMQLLGAEMITLADEMTTTRTPDRESRKP